MKRRVWSILLVVCLFASMSCLFAPKAMANDQAVVYDGNSMTTFSRSKSEVMAAYQKAYNPGNGYVEGNTGTYYAVPASTFAPYYKGDLKKSTLEAMAGVTNFFRYLTGLNPVTVNTTSDASLQAQALDRNFEHAHYIHQSSKPSDMSQAMWDEGFEKNHDIYAWGYHPLRAIKEWINEGYHNGWDTLGHRIAIISADVKEIHYGYCGNVALGAYDVRWDNSGFKEAFAAFPAPGPVPNWLVDPKWSSWSVELNPDYLIADRSAVKVTVTNLVSGSSYTCTSGNKLRFYGPMFDFAQPSDYSGSAYTAPYKVSITGLKDSKTGQDAEITYTVEFFDEQLSSAVTPGWHQDSNGWWYQNADGSYLRNCWKCIDGNWYYFTDSGYVKTGWLEDGANWYYFSKDGYMKTDWLQDGGNWYYFSKDGYMKTGWVLVDGTWYYFNSNGAMRTGWLQDGGTWYYFSKDGYMKTGWVKVDGNWYYFNDDGTIHTGWLQDGVNRYYFSKDGYLKTGWLLYEGDWYYFSQGGYMKTGWVSYNGDWYYMNSDGTMATDQWIGDYYVKSNGVMATDEWIGDYYVDEDGRWVPGKVKEN